MPASATATTLILEAAASCPGPMGLRFAYLDVSSIDLSAVKRLNCRLRFIIAGQLDEGKSLTATGGFIGDEPYRTNSVLTKHFSKCFLSRVVG